MQGVTFSVVVFVYFIIAGDSSGNRIISDQPLEPTLKRTVIEEAHYTRLRGRPRLNPVRVIPRIETPSNEVEHRSLSEYAALIEVGA